MKKDSSPHSRKDHLTPMGWGADFGDPVNFLTQITVYDVTWCLTHANEYSKINAMYGPCNYKAVNWETSEEAYTTEQYEEFAAAFDAATNA